MEKDINYWIKESARLEQLLKIATSRATDFQAKAFFTDLNLAKIGILCETYVSKINALLEGQKSLLQAFEGERKHFRSQIEGLEATIERIRSYRDIELIPTLGTYQAVTREILDQAKVRGGELNYAEILLKEVYGKDRTK